MRPRPKHRPLDNSPSNPTPCSPVAKIVGRIDLEHPQLPKGIRSTKPMITKSDLLNWFTYHKPRLAQIAKYELIRDAALAFATSLVENTPPGPDQEAAVRKVRKAVMTANAAIACNE